MATNPYANLRGDQWAQHLSRKWGTVKNVVDPYITGYHFSYWSYLPSQLLNYVNIYASTNAGFKSLDEIRNILAGSNLSVTLPTVTINKADFQGLGGLTWSAPTSITEDNNCSMRFLEVSGLPIHNIFHGWVRLIRDYRSGTSGLTNTNEYSKSNYAATMFYWTTEPNGRQVEFAACLAGLFPTKDPRDSFGHDLATIDKLEIDIDFSVDRVFREGWVFNRCKQYASSLYNSNTPEIQGGSTQNPRFFGVDS